jgi:hypothetical protein
LGLVASAQAVVASEAVAFVPQPKIVSRPLLDSGLLVWETRSVVAIVDTVAAVAVAAAAAAGMIAGMPAGTAVDIVVVAVAAEWVDGGPQAAIYILTEDCELAADY